MLYKLEGRINCLLQDKLIFKTQCMIAYTGGKTYSTFFLL